MTPQEAVKILGDAFDSDRATVQARWYFVDNKEPCWEVGWFHTKDGGPSHFFFGAELEFLVDKALAWVKEGCPEPHMGAKP